MFPILSLETRGRSLTFHCHPCAPILTRHCHSCAPILTPCLPCHKGLQNFKPQSRVGTSSLKLLLGYIWSQKWEKSPTKGYERVELERQVASLLWQNRLFIAAGMAKNSPIIMHSKGHCENLCKEAPAGPASRLPAPWTVGPDPVTFWDEHQMSTVCLG